MRGFKLSTGIYTCGKCGAPVSKHSGSCPRCGVSFGGIKCRNCGFTGSSSSFPNDICPKCGRNAYTGRRSGAAADGGGGDDRKTGTGCSVISGLALVIAGIFAGMSTGCSAVSIILGISLLTVAFILGMKISAEKQTGPVADETPRAPQKKAAMVRLYPRTGWMTGGAMYIPHGWSWDAGMEKAEKGADKFIVSGDMGNRMLYAHFRWTGTAWAVDVTEDLP